MYTVVGFVVSACVSMYNYIMFNYIIFLCIIILSVVLMNQRYSLMCVLYSNSISYLLAVPVAIGITETDGICR